MTWIKWIFWIILVPTQKFDFVNSSSLLARAFAIEALGPGAHLYQKVLKNFLPKPSILIGCSWIEQIILGKNDTFQVWILRILYNHGS